ncbi:hypothetical protein C8A03DRAFT_11200, partial [Achaetomium macrosporum]
GSFQLFYTIWTGKVTIRDFKFIRLGTLRSDLEPRDTDHWLDIIEMYFALMFRTLQRETMRKCLGADDLDIPDHGLNVSLPLHHWSSPSRIASIFACLKSDDPEVKAYGNYRRNQLMARASAAKLAQVSFVPAPRTTKAVCKNPRWRAKFHKANPAWGEPTKVRVFCRACGHVRYDEYHYYHNKSGAYVARYGYCPCCKPSPSLVKKGCVTAIQAQFPLGNIFATVAFLEY